MIFRIILSIVLVITIATLSIAFTFMFDFGIGSENEGIQAQLTGAGGEIIADDANVVFDTVLNDQSDDITYSPTTGEFTITRPGNYYIAWSVATDGAGPSINVSFAVTVNGLPYSTMSSPIVSGELSGEALVTVETVPAVITLVNVTGEGVFIPSTPVQANIVILR